MAVTLEQVEKLREKSGLSYEQARQLLEQTGGDLLEALIILERQGTLQGWSAYYSTRPAEAGEPQAGASSAPGRGSGKSRAARALLMPAKCLERRSGQGGKGTQSSFKEQLRQLLAAGLDLLRHATVNQFQVWRNGEMTTSMPVLILILLVVAAFWISLPLLVLGLFFGYKYRFAGPDVEDNKVSETMGRVSDAVHGMVEQVKDEFHRAARRDNDNK